MEPPPFALQNGYKDAIKILNPPSKLKPEEDFKSLLSEYKTWIKQHRDKSSADFLKVSREMGPDEDSSWEIRKALRKEAPAFGRSFSRKPLRRVQNIQEAPQAMKWHIILHLARNIEDERREADSMLIELKDKGSPLEGLLGEEDAKNLLTDLNPFESDLQTPLYSMDLILEAWFALFGGYLKGDELLLTFSRHIMDYTSKAWDAMVREVVGKVSPEHGKATQWEPSGRTFHDPYKYFFPVSSHQLTLKENKFMEYFSGKTMILVEGEPRI
jgi:hypothetical protein